MNCPSCKDRLLRSVEIEPELHCYGCVECSGNWIPQNEYDKWQKEQVKREPGVGHADSEIQIDELRRCFTDPEGQRLIEERIIAESEKLARAEYFFGNYRFQRVDYPYENEVFSIKIGDAAIMSVFKLKEGCHLDQRYYLSYYDG